MKKFVYQVAAWEFVDSVAFGQAWQDAKAKAAELGAPIYRLIIKGEDTRQEVFMTAGCFLRADLADAQGIKVF
jgi:hypothetical protein